MIRISLGNVGSGKTVCEVREMFLNKANRKTYSNIKTKLKNQVDINAKMIIKETITDYKKKKDGTTEPIVKHELNREFWQQLKEPINVVLDEAHAIINARRAMSKINIITSDWLALIRRVLGSSESGYGELVFITQIPRRLDVIAREMATQVRYHVCHYRKTCDTCWATWVENSELPEQIHRCPICRSWKIKKHQHQIEIWHFEGMDGFNAWKNFKMDTYYKHYYIKNIEKYFPLYNFLSWDNMFSEFY